MRLEDLEKAKIGTWRDLSVVVFKAVERGEKEEPKVD